MISGAAGTTEISASCQSRMNMIPMPIRKTMLLTIRKTSGNARNSRMVNMSDVALDSSCPEAQRSWKLTGSRCSRA